MGVLELLTYVIAVVAIIAWLMTTRQLASVAKRRALGHEAQQLTSDTAPLPAAMLSRRHPEPANSSDIDKLFHAIGLTRDSTGALAPITRTRVTVRIPHLEQSILDRLVRSELLLPSASSSELASVNVIACERVLKDTVTKEQVAQLRSAAK